jgi:hypothetical protein
MDVWLWRPPAGEHVVVCTTRLVGGRGDGIGVSLTPDEARELAGHLSRWAEIVETINREGLSEPEACRRFPEIGAELPNVRR